MVQEKMVQDQMEHVAMKTTTHFVSSNPPAHTWSTEDGKGWSSESKGGQEFSSNAKVKQQDSHYLVLGAAAIVEERRKCIAD